MELSNILAAYSLCQTLYGITPNEDDFEDLALEAWNRIGNKHTRLYRYIGEVKDGVLESVHAPFPDAQMTSSSANYPWAENMWIEHYIDRRSHSSDPYFQKGKLIRYDEGNGELYFAHNYPKIMVVYHGILVDDETGLPLVNDKELRAIATFVAYHDLYKDAIKKRDGNLLKLAQVVQADWLRLCNAARIPEHVSQNDMDAILDVATRWDRKVYNKSFKPLR